VSWLKTATAPIISEALVTKNPINAASTACSMVLVSDATKKPPVLPEHVQMYQSTNYPELRNC